jgi:hypothetical protein
MSPAHLAGIFKRLTRCREPAYRVNGHPCAINGAPFGTGSYLARPLLRLTGSVRGHRAICFGTGLINITHRPDLQTIRVLD